MFQRTSNVNRKNVTARQENHHALRSATTVIITILNSLLVFFLCAHSDSMAAKLSGSTFEEVLTKHPEQPWRLKADEVGYDQKADIYIAKGNVEITKADKKLTADYVRFDHKTMTAYAQGNVMLISGQDVLTASRIDIDLENQVGTVENGRIFLKENNFHIQGDIIQKTGENTYTIDKATLTTCDGDKPAWKITGRNIIVHEDGHGTAKHATLWARGLPVLYTPYFYYPARSERQSGFLVPEFGQSERKGSAYNQPFFWAISDSQDATFYAHYMTKRGIKTGAEYRYYWDETTKGAIQLDGFQDNKEDTGGTSSDRYGFEDPGEQILRENKDRWWFRMSHHQDAPLNFDAKLDLDIVSDQDYLREFKDGYMGWEDSQKYFTKHFRRNLDDYNDPVRLNRFNLNRIWPTWSLNTELRYFYDSTQQNSNTADKTVSRLPVVDLEALKQQMWFSPFFFDLNSNYNYFWRPSGTRAQRIDVHPRFYWPYRFKNFFTFEPSIGFRETAYYLNQKTFGDETNKDQTLHRELFDARLDLFSEVYNVFNVDYANIRKIKHSIRPQIIYDFVPDKDQDDLPIFDAEDRIDEKSLLTYSITNTFTSKSIKKRAQKLAERQDVSRGDIVHETSRSNYTDFARFRLEQSYDFKKSKRAFSPIFAKLDLLPGKYISIDADSGWSVYDQSFVSHNVAAAIWDNRGDKLFVDYRYSKVSEEEDPVDQQNIQSILLDAIVTVTDQLSVNAGYERNLEDSIDIRKRLGFSYEAKCWSFDFRFVKEPEDKKIEFKINLYGLGGIGL